jgi:RNA polymerase sigma-70 factor (ECF subfamily)
MANPTSMPSARADILMNGSDGELIARAAKGDSDALSALFQQHAPGIHRVATLITLSPDDADDVVQDVFVGLPEALRQYTDRGAFSGWLRMVATRFALMRLRARRRDRVDRVDPDVLAELASVEQPDRVAVWDALGRLSPEQRTVFVLKVIEGYQHQEIAATLGISRAASEARLFRAIHALRILLGATST